MNIKEEIMQECLTRMKMLGLDKSCICAFKNGKVWESEGIGALYEVNEQEQAIIDEFEKQHENYKVYHSIHNIFEFGEVYSLFYVSTNKEEWKEDKEDIENGYALVYCKNVDDDFCSEFGSIAFKSNIGGLIRIG